MQELFTTYFKSKGWEQEENIVYGNIDDYLVQVFQGPRYKLILIPLPAINATEKKAVLRFLRANKIKFKFNTVRFNNTVLDIRVKEFFKTSQNEILSHIVDETIQFLKENQISPGKNCIFCGKAGAEKTINILRIRYYAHHDCYEQALKETDEQMNETQKEKIESANADYSSLGAFIGALVTSGIWVIISVYTWIGFIAAAFIPLVALRFYRIFNGKVNKRTSSVLTLTVFFAMILAVITIIFINKITLHDFIAPNGNSLNIILGIVFILYSLHLQRKFIKTLTNE